MQIYTNAASNAIHSRPPSSFGDSDVELNAQSAPKAANSGYYGSTSYYSVFDRADHVPTATTDSQPSGPVGNTLSTSTHDDDLGVSRSLQLGSWILQNLQHVSIIQSLVDMYIRTSQVSPTATLIPLKAVETLQHLASGDLHALAQKITRNTQKPLQIPPEMHASTFSTLFTGDNLRWEFLGLVFAWAGLSLSMSLLNEKGSATTPDGISKTSFARLLTACTSNGEAGHASWQRLGDLSTDILALGLHKEPAATSTSPVFLVQARKKLFSAAFRVDKSISTFFGRPPRIPGHYCDVGLPLDIDDNLFHQENFCVDHLRSVLNMAGWNIDCKIRPASWIRMRHTVGEVTEEILELSLGGAQDNLVYKVHMRMLTAAMILPGIQVDSVNIHRDRAWILLYYALPSAGVLAIDLRMRMQQGSNLPRSISKSEVIRHTSVLAASLQWASEPPGGNHNLCAEAAKTLSRILDEILDSSEMSTSGDVSGTMSGTVSGNMSHMAMDMDYSMLAEHGVDSETFLNWFDNLEWETIHQPVPLQV
ncbi:hypothetical protein N0V94_007396 [Neodidymelliopsis sp. IMI 364377]|nr:hypothetical protein N0V94_007396 [Neodidymelliopsis sp. IMI 364377]